MSLTLGNKDYLKLGDYNAVCDVCGMKFKASELRRRWDNMRVCATDYEERHPQDLIRIRSEKQTPPWTRPPQTEYVVVAPIDPTTL